MPTDLTGTPTSLGIGTYNVDADAPSGLGFNAAMGEIDALIAARVATPAGVRVGDVPVWNGTTWGKPGGTPSSTVYLRGDGSWVANEIGYDQITANVGVTSTTSATPTTIIAGSAHTFEGQPVVAEFFTPLAITPAVASGFLLIGLYESAVLIAQMAQLITTAGAVMQSSLTGRFRFTPSAGSHTYSIGAWVSSTTGGPTIVAGSGTGGAYTPSYLRFTRANS